MGDVESVRDCWNLDGPHLSSEDAVAQVERIILNHERNQLGTFVHLCLAIIEKASGKYIGWCGIDHNDKSLAFPVIFFLLKKAYWGQGLATEAASAVLSFGLVDLGLQRIDGACAADNLASMHVMEKIGMHFIGHDKAGGIQLSVYREEYLNKNNLHVG
jgi:RimJ/RimL family protein N-acetyltransferase